MTKSINEVLQDLLDRHGRVLLENPRRFESLLRDSTLASRDIAGLVAALKDGVPNRLAALPKEAPSPQTVTSIATEFSERSGLRQDVAQGSVEAWAHALRLGKPGAAEPKNPETVTPVQESVEKVAVDVAGSVPEKRKSSIWRLTAPPQTRGSWKTAALLPPVVIAGAVVGLIVAAVYYAVVGILLSQFFGTANLNLGVLVGSAAGAFGIPLGIIIALGIVQSRRGFDRRCWIVAAIFGLPFIVLALLNLGNAFVLWGHFKVFGFFALFGFGAFLERLDQMLNLKWLHE